MAMNYKLIFRASFRNVHVTGLCYINRVMNRGLNRRGQFIPMAAMIMLSTLVFMIGVVNVYRISRAKLKAQNLADAVALYVASEMAQSMNNVADRNEWLNHMYADAQDPTATQASHDPCSRTDPLTPPGLGCFARRNGANFYFHHQDGFKAYARLVATINDIQQKFAASYNTFIGANPNAQGNNGVSTFQTNLMQQIPALQDTAHINVVVYNSEAEKNNADTLAPQIAAALKPGGNASPQLNSPIALMRPITFKSHDIDIQYDQCGTLHCHRTHGYMKDILGARDPIGYMDIDGSQGAYTYIDSSKGTIGAGDIVTISVPLIGISNTTVQSKSSAYVVMNAGALAPDQNGRFSPTYWVKLGAP